LVVVVLAIAGLALMKMQETNKVTKEDKEEDGRIHIVEGEAGERTYQYGDVVYVPADGSIGYGAEAGLLLYADLLNVFLTSDLSDAGLEELLGLVDGELLGRLKGDVNILQLGVAAKSLAEIDALAEALQEQELVKYAKQSAP